MIPELGEFSLILALAFALLQSTFALFAKFSGESGWEILVKRATGGQFFFVALALLSLAYSFFANDFSVVYVAENSNTHLPIFYKLAAVWGAHEGSLLLWIFILACWSIAVSFFDSRSKYVNSSFILPSSIPLGILGFLSAGFLVFILMTSSPFKRYLPLAPAEGADLNALLQDPGLTIHPPMLYFGYVGFAVVFAFAIAALFTNKLDSEWAKRVRPWAICAWCFLTVGICLGSWWAYRVLGWGGWWFWDPVENAALLPWLTGTALIHALIMVEKKQQLKQWTILLAICAFSLSLLGTFLVRSGILISVHSFVSDPNRGRFLLEFLAIVIGSSLLLFAIKAPALNKSESFSFLSRETFLLINNILLMVIMGTILLGTLYPLFFETLGFGRISVGAPYFNAVVTPLLIPLLLSMGIGPLCYWEKISFSRLIKNLLPSLVILLFLIAVCVSLVAIPLSVFIGLTLAAWITVSTLQAVYLQARQNNLNWRMSGMVLAHLGVAVCVVGISFVSAYQVERDVVMQVGDTATVGSYNFKLVSINNAVGPNYQATQGLFQIDKNNQLVSTLTAEKRTYAAQSTTTTLAAIDAGLFRDLYLALGDPLSDTRWSVRIYYKPFVRWIWGGGLMMLLGGLLTLCRVKYPPPVLHRKGGGTH